MICPSLTVQVMDLCLNYEEGAYLQCVGREMISGVKLYEGTCQCTLPVEYTEATGGKGQGD